jgi:hypothetical protein
MNCPYLFVLAGGLNQLPNCATHNSLEELQEKNLSNGFCLRIHRCPQDWQSNIKTLVELGDAAEGYNPLTDKNGSLLCCDAIIPNFQPNKHCLGIYKNNCDLWELIDGISLTMIKNETCWFYPTENGTYLSWHSQLRLKTKPGQLAEPHLLEMNEHYSRSKLHLLWSLMADEKEMTPVGITYRDLRIDWDLVSCKPETFSTWSSFRVDDMAPIPLEVISKIRTTRKIITSGVASK